jgi:hypothetical protein
MMFRVFQVDDSTIVDCFTGVARSDVILSFFFTRSGDTAAEPELTDLIVERRRKK